MRIEMKSPYGLVYGPHKSIRLGLSLGIDLTPMTCTFDCVYCERGRTLLKIQNPSQVHSKVCKKEFIEELRRNLVKQDQQKFKSIVFSGTGEPTLDTRLDEFIRYVKKESSIPVKVFTNSSLLTRSEIRRRLSEADQVIAKMNTASNSVFWSMHRPADRRLSPEKIAEGISRLVEEGRTEVVVEVLLITSYPGGLLTNDTREEIRRISKTLKEVQPSKVHIHTIRRPPAHPLVRPVSKDLLLRSMNKLKKDLGKEKVQVFI
jgi:wyosine [tRNA(Phe)-imidazoG37] synthetase (radical SAM superfamily)